MYQSPKMSLPALAASGLVAFFTSSAFAQADSGKGGVVIPQVQTIQTAPAVAPTVQVAPVAPRPAALVVKAADSKVIADSVRNPNGVVVPANKLAYTIGGNTLTLYGRVQFNGAWQNHRGNYAPADYVSYAGTGSAAQTGQWAGTGNASRLGVRYLGGNLDGVSYDGKVEGDFYGNLRQTTANGAGGTQNEQAPLFQLRHAFATVSFNSLGLRILAGQTTELLCPLEQSAAYGNDFGSQLINFNGLSGSGTIGNRTPQLQLRETFGLTQATKTSQQGTLAIAGAVERAVGAAQYYTNSSNQQPDAAEESDIPAFAGRTELSLPLWVDNKNAIVGVAGHFAQEDFLDSASNHEHTLNSWSFVTSIYLPLHKYVVFNAQYGFGADLYNHSANIGQPISYVTTNGVFTKFYRPRGTFGYAALRLNPDHKAIPIPLILNAGFGFDSVYTSTLKPHSQARTRNITSYANFNYYVTPTSYFGFEVSRIETDYLDKGATTPGTVEDLWRYELVYQYNF